MSVGLRYFRSSVNRNTFTLLTYPRNSFANCSVLGNASGSSAITTVVNRDKYCLCASESEVPNTATPTYTPLSEHPELPVAPTMAALTQSSTTTPVLPCPYTYGKGFFPYLFHFGNFFPSALPVASTIMLLCTTGNTTRCSRTSYNNPSDIGSMSQSTQN